MDKLKIVADFIGQYSRSWPPSIEASLEVLDDDAYYQMVVPTIAPVKGKANIIAALKTMTEKVKDQKHDMISIACAGDFVFTERVDYSLRNNAWVPVPLVAIFQVNDAGKIYAWREYLDLFNNLKNHGLSFEEMQQTIAAL